MNESNEQKNNKINEIPRVIIWYYRVIGVTFGGIQFNQNRQLVSNEWLRFIGFLATISYFVAGFFFIHFRMHDPDYIALYQNGLHFTYYLSALILVTDIIQIVVNQLFLNSNAIPMFDHIYRLGLGLD